MSKHNRKGLTRVEKQKQILNKKRRARRANAKRLQELGSRRRDIRNVRALLRLLLALDMYYPTGLKGIQGLHRRTAAVYLSFSYMQDSVDFEFSRRFKTFIKRTDLLHDIGIHMSYGNPSYDVRIEYEIPGNYVEHFIKGYASKGKNWVHWVEDSTQYLTDLVAACRKERLI